MFVEFKTFISKGNVLDMAIGVIIATAFGKITTALVNDVLMPLIGAIFGGSSLTDALNITLKPAVLDAEGNVVTEASVLGLGIFLNAIIDFIIVAFICFLIVKAFNKAREKAEAKKKAEAEAEAKKKAEEEAKKPKEPTAEELLKEIRDLLKAKK
ncbi:MAG: large conductance mechanosensitive channel protein MscL [Oscillospiraceae bacterium]|nr:large conductance mechanosensitive channel protein MscL [Oscillospiraceae bacterium]